MVMLFANRELRKPAPFIQGPGPSCFYSFCNPAFFATSPQR